MCFWASCPHPRHGSARQVCSIVWNLRYIDNFNILVFVVQMDYCWIKASDTILSVRLILQPQDIILSPAGKDTIKEFCTQSCLTTFNEKKNNATQKPSQTVGLQSRCSMCSKFCIVSTIKQGSSHCYLYSFILFNHSFGFKTFEKGHTSQVTLS